MPNAADRCVEFEDAGFLEDQLISFMLGDTGREPIEASGSSMFDNPMERSVVGVVERDSASVAFAALGEDWKRRGKISIFLVSNELHEMSRGR